MMYTQFPGENARIWLTRPVPVARYIYMTISAFYRGKTKNEMREGLGEDGIRKIYHVVRNGPLAIEKENSRIFVLKLRIFSGQAREAITNVRLIIRIWRCQCDPKHNLKIVSNFVSQTL